MNADHYFVVTDTNTHALTHTRMVNTSQALYEPLLDLQPHH